MKNNKEDDIEKMLLEGASLEDLIKMKIETEFKNRTEQAKHKPQKVTYTEITKVPSKYVFSKDSVFKVFNKNSKCESFINGVQAEALIGTQYSVREQMLNGLLSAFVTEDAYVKFEKADVWE